MAPTLFRRAAPDVDFRPAAEPVWQESGAPALFTIVIDARRKQSNDALVPLKIGLTGGGEGAWSPSGDRVAFVVPQRQGASRPSVAIQTLATNGVRTIEVPLQRVQNPAWWPDERALIVQGTDLERQQGLFKIDLDSGRLSTVASADAASGRQREHPAISPDGKRLYFLGGASAGDLKKRILVRDLDTDEEQVLTVGDAGEIQNFALSSDGTQLAVVRRGKDPADLEVMETGNAGGRPRQMTQFKGGWTINSAIVWSPDSLSVLVARAGAKGQEIWRVSLENWAEKTGLSCSGAIGRLSMDPKSGRLLISATSSK